MLPFVSAKLISIEHIALQHDYLSIGLNVTYYFINIVSSLSYSCFLLSMFLVFVLLYTYYLYLFFCVSCNML